MPEQSWDPIMYFTAGVKRSSMQKLKQIAGMESAATGRRVTRMDILRDAIHSYIEQKGL